jgi:glycosyltransferase involved in cell wall biosynthesis
VSGPRLAVVMSGFPRHSETFALADLDALDRAGMLAAILSTKEGDGGVCQPAAERFRGRVRQLSGPAAAQAAGAARLLAGERISGVHGYFAHTPADVASRIARELRVPFGFSAHARDARKLSRLELHRRARRAACVVACNADVAAEFDGADARITLVPHGVDLERFAPRTRAASGVFRLLAVGRLVEKKGFHVLIDAASRLDIPWSLRLVGGGPERQRLVAQVEAAGITGRVTFCGTLTHRELPAEYGRADVVVVPSVCDATGDRDGLPNVLLEAMASGAAVAATDAGAIATVVRDGQNGALVPAGDAAALAGRLSSLAGNPRLRDALGAAGRSTVERDFDTRSCTLRFASVLGAAYA